MYLRELSCTECDRTVTATELRRLCPSCGSPLQACYDLEAIREAVTPAEVTGRNGGMWRFREVLPDPGEPITFGEGDTPLLRTPRLGNAIGLGSLWVKDEGVNPTGSFKARGMSAAVSMAKALGATALTAPSAGNAGGALAAYGARAGLPVHIAMPRDVPAANRIEAEICGAHVTLIDGNIKDCGKWVGERAEREGWFDVSTLKEPYRVEGKKTMGYELAMQLDWTLPDVILYPTGGGTGLVGMWKAFAEMRELGWVTAKPPRMIAVQAKDCAPVVEAFHAGAERITAPESPATIASGLRVPTPIGDRWMLRVVRESEGTAIAVTDDELLEGCRRLARDEGIFTAPEAGALVIACEKLVADGTLATDERTVLFLTGTGLKYLECF